MSGRRRRAYIDSSLVDTCTTPLLRNIIDQTLLCNRFQIRPRSRRRRSGLTRRLANAYESDYTIKVMKILLINAINTIQLLLNLASDFSNVNGLDLISGLDLVK